MNVSDTTPYNADFDGDEMNMHAPQSIKCISELINIASVNNQIISPRENKPIISIVQDTLLGIYKLTQYNISDTKQGQNMIYNKNTNIYQIKDTTQTQHCIESCIYTRSQTSNILCQLSTYNGLLPTPDKSIKLGDKTIEYWSGKCILSYILPYISHYISPYIFPLHFTLYFTLHFTIHFT